MITAAIAAAACTWNAPGADPYRGPVVPSVAAAVARYGMPADVQAELVQKAKLLQPDGLVIITRDGLHSRDGEAANLRDMHFGRGRVCAGPVVRNRWRDDQAEAAFVYCAQGQCIAIPIVCGNVSRIDFTPRPPLPGDPPRAWIPGPPPIHRVPEPASLALVAAGLGLVALASRRRK